MVQNRKLHLKKKLIITALFVNNLHTVTDSIMTTMQGDGLFH